MKYKVNLYIRDKVVSTVVVEAFDNENARENAWDLIFTESGTYAEIEDKWVDDDE